MSASSIIQFYLNTEDTHTSNLSRNELSKSITKLEISPNINTENSPSTKNLDSYVIHKVENLPTAPTITLSTLSSQPIDSNNNSNVSSFFSIPLKFFSNKYFNLNSSSTITKYEAKTASDYGSKGSSPIEIITDSPVEILSGSVNIDEFSGTNTGTDFHNSDQNTFSMERTNSDLLKTSQDRLEEQFGLINSTDYDPIYDTYISYINHTTAEGDLILDDDLSDNNKNLNPSMNHNNVEPAENETILDLNQDRTEAKQELLRNDYENIEFEFGESTSKRIKTKTKSFIRELSRRYSNATSKSTNEVKSETGGTPQLETFRNGLKRRLSNVASKRHDSISKWKRSIKASEERNVLGPTLTTSLSHNNNPDINGLGRKNNQSQKDNSLSELFQSSDFATRLKLGSVTGRKLYTDSDYNGNENEYQVSYRCSNDTNQPAMHRGHFGDYQFHSLQERFSSIKDHTIRRSQSIAKYFTQEV